MPDVTELVAANSALEQFVSEFYESVSSIRPKCVTKCARVLAVDDSVHAQRAKEVAAAHHELRVAEKPKG